MIKRKKVNTNVKNRNIKDILNDPIDVSKLQGFLDEGIVQKEIVSSCNEQIKHIRNEALSQIGLSPKLYNQMLSALFNHKIKETQDELQSLDFAIEKLFVPLQK